MSNDGHPDDLDGRAAEIERQRRELEAERQQFEQLQRQRDLEAQELELERRRQELDAQRAHLEQRSAPTVQQDYSYQPPAEPPTQPTPQVPYPATQAAAPPPRRNIGVIVLVGIIALAAGAAGGWFGYDVLNDDAGDSQEVATGDATDDAAQTGATETTDSSDTDSSDTDTAADGADAADAEPTPAEPTATPIPIEVTTWKSGDGDLQASFPADYTVAWDTQEFDGVSALLLYGASDFPAANADGFNRFTGETVNVGAYTRPGLTPEILLGEVFEPDPECTGEDPPEPAEAAGRTGILVRSTDCGGVGGERLRMAFQAAPDVVTYVSVRSATAGGGTTIANAMAASLSTEPDADTATAAPFGCAQVGPSPDPEFPLVTVVVNRTDDDISFYELDPSTGGPYSGNTPLELPPGFSNFLTFRSEGGFVLRIDRPQGPLDYTMTDALAQCILVTDEGLLAG